MGKHKYDFPDIEGQPAKMLVDGMWHRGKIVNGYRFRDGIVTIEDDEGKRYWCGEARTELYKPL